MYHRHMEVQSGKRENSIRKSMTFLSRTSIDKLEIAREYKFWVLRRAYFAANVRGLEYKKIILFGIKEGKKGKYSRSISDYYGTTHSHTMNLNALHEGENRERERENIFIIQKRKEYFLMLYLFQVPCIVFATFRLR